MKLDPKAFKAYNDSRAKHVQGLVCHAPFNSLNFEQGGNVTSCCYNRTHVLGKYPINSLQDIWKGDKANELRSYIKQNDLNHGCELCGQQINSFNFEGSRAKGFDVYAENPNNKSALSKLKSKFQNKLPPPSVLEFEIDNICNLECVMCSGKYSSLIRKNREKLPPLKSPYDDQFVEQLKPFLPTLKEAKFLGGEPFLNPIYYKIWDLMMEINPRIEIYITTNATILTKKVKEILERLNVNLVISIDAISKDLYEEIRQNANYEKVMENINYFFEFGQKTGKEVSFTVCPMTNNWKEIPKLIEFCNFHNKNIYFNTVVYPLHLSLKSLHYKELKEVLNYLQNFNFKQAGLYFKKNLLAFSDFLNYLNEVFSKNHLVFLNRFNIIEDFFTEELKDKDYSKLSLFYLYLQRNNMGNGELKDPEFNNHDAFERLKTILKHLGEQKSVLSILEILKIYSLKENPDLSEVHINQLFSTFKSFLEKEIKDIPELLFSLMSKEINIIVYGISNAKIEELERNLRNEYVNKISYNID